jgi:hypothetical protein
VLDQRRDHKQLKRKQRVAMTIMKNNELNVRIHGESVKIIEEN